MKFRSSFTGLFLAVLAPWTGLEVRTVAVAPGSPGRIPANAPPAPAARPPGEWCTTETTWQKKALRLYGVQLVPSCPSPWVCDDPATRDAHIPNSSTPVKIIRLNIIVFRETDGSNPAATHEGIDAQLAQMNADYAPYRYRFVHTCRFVNDSTYRDLAETEVDTMKNAYAERPDIQCNVFVTDLSWGDLGRGTFP